MCGEHRPVGLDGEWARRVIHRDLKPGNVMLVPDPAVPTGERLKILDFGLAKLSEVREAAFVKTKSQAVFGTPRYMSPEQCEGAGRVDAKTDVYSLGCMLYEMLAGRTPFLGEGPSQVIGQHLFKEPEPLTRLVPQLPAALSQLVGRLLIKSRETRPSMRETQKALEALAAELPPPHRREVADPSGMRPPGALVATGFDSTLGEGSGEGQPQSSGGAMAFAPTLNASPQDGPAPARDKAAKAAPAKVAPAKAAPARVRPAPRASAGARLSRRTLLLGAALLGALALAAFIGLRPSSQQTPSALPAAPTPATPAPAAPAPKAPEPEAGIQKSTPEPKKKPASPASGGGRRRSKKTPLSS